MLNLRYRGQFLDIDGTVWQIDILQEGYQGTVGELTFDADEPLVIDWKETSKEEAICSSEATLRIESPGDRTFEDLYTIAPGEIRMDVFRQGQLYWSGLLDPEFYEEPYERARDYTVALTFSDFGILDRLRFEGLTGKSSVWMILGVALDRAHLNYTMDYVPGSSPGPTAIPTFSSLRFFGGQSTAPLDEISVLADNFYDEDGDPCTFKEAIEGILQPLGLKMIQRSGKIWVFDLNGLYANSTPELIAWDGDSQTMGADKVYNNIKVTWSPYVKDGNLADEECFVKGTDRNVLELNKLDGATHGDCTVFSYHASTDPDDWTDLTDSGFSLWLATEGKNARLEDADARFFKILSQEGGEDCQGIALRWPGYGLSNNGWVTRHYHGPGWSAGSLGSSVGPPLWRSLPVALPAMDHPERYLLHITLEMLMDCRFNPFEEAENLGQGLTDPATVTDAQKEFYDRWNGRGNFVYVPVTVKFQPEGSDELYSWQNDIGRLPDRRFRKNLTSTLGGWASISRVEQQGNPLRWGYFAWYDANDRDKSSGVLGWKPNRPAIEPHLETLASSLGHAGDGQWLPLPTGIQQGGQLWIEVRSKGWIVADGGEQEPYGADSNELWQIGTAGDCKKTRWCLMKLPQVEVRKAQTYDNELDNDDVEYKAVCNEHAREGLELQTICGTAEGGVAMARGAYWHGLSQIEQMTRAGRTAPVEQLLIGTLYSQFATRHTTIEGEAAIHPGGLTTYTERNQGAKRFMLLSERQDVRMGTADCLFCELSPDQYDRETQQ